MRRRRKGASGTAGDTGDGRVAVNVRVRVYPGTDGEVGGTVVEDFGDLAGHAVEMGENHTVGPARRCGLPRVSRTADFVSIYAATCEFRYSVRTSCGVR